MEIRDKLLEPFFVKVTEEQFVLTETKTIDVTHHMSKGEEGEREVPVGYYTDFTALIKKVIFLQKARSEEVVTLEEYLNSWKEQVELLTNLIKPNLPTGFKQEDE
jgi:hypothetical protein